MKLSYYYLPLVLAVAGPLTAATITVNNPGFEADVLGCAAGPGCFANPFAVPSWTISGATTTFKPSTGAGNEFPGGIPEGVNVLAMGNGSSGSAFQVTPAIIQLGLTYILNVQVGHRADFGFSAYQIALGGTANQASATSSVALPGAGTFVPDTVSYTVLAGDPNIGSALRITLSSTGVSPPGAASFPGQADFDAVTLSDNSGVPEPSAFILMGLGLIPFYLRRRRA